MIKRMIVKNLNGEMIAGASSSEFDSIESFEAWIEKMKAQGAYGHPGNEEYIDESGAVVPARAPEFTVEILDITEEVEAREALIEQKRTLRAQRIAALKAANLDGITTIAQCRAILKFLVQEILKDED